MLPTASPLILFTDLDGCLLNKHDYDWSPAAATLQTLRDRQIPVVMNSSKTVPEMSQLADQLGLADYPFISENGSVIRWGGETGQPLGDVEIIGASREHILELLNSLKHQYRFRSFDDLGLADAPMISTSPRKPSCPRPAPGWRWRVKAPSRCFGTTATISALSLKKRCVITS